MVEVLFNSLIIISSLLVVFIVFKMFFGKKSSINKQVKIDSVCGHEAKVGEYHIKNTVYRSIFFGLDVKNANNLYQHLNNLIPENLQDELADSVIFLCNEPFIDNPLYISEVNSLIEKYSSKAPDFCFSLDKFKSVYYKKEKEDKSNKITMLSLSLFLTIAFLTMIIININNMNLDIHGPPLRTLNNAIMIIGFYSFLLFSVSQLILRNKKIKMKE